MNNEQYDSALAILDEGLQTAGTENNAEEIAARSNQDHSTVPRVEINSNLNVSQLRVAIQMQR